MKNNLKCTDCKEDSIYLDHKGFIYCEEHGLERKSYVRKTRKMSKSEIATIINNKQIEKY